MSELADIKNMHLPGSVVLVCVALVCVALAGIALAGIALVGIALVGIALVGIALVCLILERVRSELTTRPWGTMSPLNTTSLRRNF